jgi:hypothetical protein
VLSLLEHRVHLNINVRVHRLKCSPKNLKLTTQGNLTNQGRGKRVSKNIRGRFLTANLASLKDVYNVKTVPNLNAAN